MFHNTCWLAGWRVAITFLAQPILSVLHSQQYHGHYSLVRGTTILGINRSGNRGSSSPRPPPPHRKVAFLLMFSSRSSLMWSSFFWFLLLPPGLQPLYRQRPLFQSSHWLPFFCPETPPVWPCHCPAWSSFCSLCAQPCLTFCDPLDYSPPGFSIHGISQARILEWVATSSFRGSYWPRDWTSDSCLLHWQAGSLPLCHLGILRSVWGFLFALSRSYHGLKKASSCSGFCLPAHPQLRPLPALNSMFQHHPNFYGSPCESHCLLPRKLAFTILSHTVKLGACVTSTSDPISQWKEESGGDGERGWVAHPLGCTELWTHLSVSGTGRHFRGVWNFQYASSSCLTPSDLTICFPILF